MKDVIVAGESAALLVEAFSRIEVGPLQQGAHRVSGTFEPRLALPFIRAHMRVEAELLLQDADRVNVLEWEVRTRPQRAADALIALVLQVQEALEARRE